jgi:hypothetical protein
MFGRNRHIGLSHKISTIGGVGIIGPVDEIVRQTNLVALHVAVEAAPATAIQDDPKWKEF